MTITKITSSSNHKKQKQARPTLHTYKHEHANTSTHSTSVNWNNWRTRCLTKVTDKVCVCVLYNVINQYIFVMFYSHSGHWIALQAMIKVHQLNKILAHFVVFTYSAFTLGHTAEGFSTPDMESLLLLFIIFRSWANIPMPHNLCSINMLLGQKQLHLPT